MLKKRSLVKYLLIGLVSVVILLSAFVFWFMSLITSSSSDNNLAHTQPQSSAYLIQSILPSRGKILAVVTSCGVLGNSGKSTGYEMTELGRAYYVFKANGFEVDIASTLGGKPPVVIDWDDMGEFDYAFLNDTMAQHKVNYSIPIDDIDVTDYQAVYFVGGKGAMFDFPDNTKIQAIVREFYQKGKVIGAVCHGPAALLNVTLDDGHPLLENKLVSGFTNTEELFLINDARAIFPFLLEDRLVDRGARYNAGYMYLEKISEDGNLITGQNPWSTWALAELMVKKLGYAPVAREKTAEEYSIDILSTYEAKGIEAARAKIRKLLSYPQKPIDRNLLAMHSVVAAMQWKIGKAFALIGLLAYVKNEMPLKHVDG
jgi:putative intracellular protease/amidase